RQVALASRDRGADGVALDGVKIRNRRGLRGDVGGVSRSGAQEGHLLRKLCCRNGVIVSRHDHTFDHVSHFAYVSGPCVSFECLDDVRFEAVHGYSLSMRSLSAEILGQLGGHLPALAPRWDGGSGSGSPGWPVLAPTA